MREIKEQVVRWAVNYIFLFEDGEKKMRVEKIHYTFCSCWWVRRERDETRDEYETDRQRELEGWEEKILLNSGD